MDIKRLFHRKKTQNNNEEALPEIVYINIPTLELSDEQLSQCAELFSLNYGNYSDKSEYRPGERIKMGTAYYRRNYINKEYSVALALDDSRIVGQAFYIRKKYEKLGKNEIAGTMTWIVQLVVDSEYRRRGIASTLLRSIWGFSDDFAWGLATANPCTIKTLESATMRKCKPAVIRRHLRDIRKIGKDIGFVKDSVIEVTEASSQINSHFFVDNKEFLLEKKDVLLKNQRKIMPLF